ncbi:MAG: hypothetical protein AAGA58_13980 [Verrucomicrobiota bacterium]
MKPPLTHLQLAAAKTGRMIRNISPSLRQTVGRWRVQMSDRDCCYQFMPRIAGGEMFFRDEENEASR